MLLNNLIEGTDDSSVWNNLLNNLKIEYGDSTYKNWFSKLDLVSVSNCEVTLSVPTNFMKEWILTYYINFIKKSWQKYDKSIIKIEIIVVQKDIKKSDANQKQNNFFNNFNKISNDDIIASPLDSRFTFENFIIDKSNQFAYSAAMNVAEENKVNQKSNPLFLYSNVGLGKTHLMQSIAWYIRKTNQMRKVIYISAERFMYQFIKALQNRDMIAFKERFRTVDLLMIDDIQFISGKGSTQEEFFHTFNSLVDNNRQVVISCDRLPNDLSNMEDRIKSRLGWGLIADIAPSNVNLRYNILKSKINRSKSKVPNSVIELLSMKVTSSIRELEGALNKVIAYSNLTNQDITIESTQKLLNDLFRSNSSAISIESIQKIVAEFYNIDINDMLSQKRNRNIVRPRQIAIYLSKNLTKKSLIDIGDKFGGKDHTTIMHAVRNIENLKQSDHSLCEELKQLNNIM